MFVFKIVCGVFIGLLYTNVSLAQKISFVDAKSKLPIPALNIYHEDGTLVGFTDKKGLLQFLEGIDVIRKMPMKITAQHISYEPKALMLKNVGKQQYELTPLSKILESVTVNFKPKEVVVLRGYFRSLETFDLQSKYFSDGVVEFYIPLGKAKPRYRLIEYRVFRDSAVVADYDAKMGPFFQIPRVPEMTEKSLSARLTDLVKDNSGGNRVNLLKKGEEVGYVTTDMEANNVQLYMDMVLPDSVIKQKIFRIEGRVLHEVHVENYASTDFERTAPYDLTSVYQNVVGSIKRKSEYGHIPYEGLNEFYVMERSFIDMQEYRAVQKDLTKSIYKTPEKSMYHTKFWEGLEPYNIPPIQSGLAKKLDERLRLVK